MHHVSDTDHYISVKVKHLDQRNLNVGLNFKACFGMIISVFKYILNTPKRVELIELSITLKKLNGLDRHFILL